MICLLRMADSSLPKEDPRKTPAASRRSKTGRGSIVEKAWNCCFCRKKFQRSDVLRRHYKTCPSRYSRPIPGPLKRGKRRQACDACANSKLSCDFELPCESCLSSGSQCTYVRISEEMLQHAQWQDEEIAPDLAFGQFEQNILSSVAENPRNYSSTASPDAEGHVAPDQSKISVSFLLNYTNPDTRSLTDTFGYSTESAVDHSETSDPSLSYTPRSSAFPFLADVEGNSSFNELIPISQSVALDGFHMPNMFYPELSMEELLPGYFFPIVDTDRMQTQYISSTSIEDQSWAGEPIFSSTGLENGITDNLIFRLTEFCLSIPSDRPEFVPSMTLSQGLPLLAPSNLQRFIGMYFQHWHRHSPIVHHGTFDVFNVSLHLLFAVLLTGAMFSPSHSEVTMAKNMLDIAEEYCFRNPVFLKLVSGTIEDNSAYPNINLEALQAACSIAQIQLREGSLAKRKYTRSTRFNEMIAAAQTLSLASAKNTFFSERLPAEPFQKNKFSQAEAQIRVVCGLFNLDSSFTIFYNSPPRLYARQLFIDMPCSMKSYLANTAADCYEAAIAESKSRPPQLGKLLFIFLDESWEAEVQKTIEGMSLMHLFIIVLALLQTIWISRLYASKALLESVRRALVRWKAKWDLTSSGMTPQQLEQAGFLRDAAIEFWHLANILTRHGKTGAELNLGADCPIVSDAESPVDKLLQRVEHLKS